MLKRTVFVWILGFSWVISVAVTWQTGSITLTSQVSAASIFPESSELPISSTVTPSRKLIRRPSVNLIPLSGLTATTPSVTISPSHTLIQRPLVSLSPPPPSPAAPPPTSLNLPGTLIRRPSVGLASATASVPTPPLTAAYEPQTSSQTVNGVIASILPSAGATTSGNTKSNNTAQAAVALGSVTAPTFAPSFRSALASPLVNPTPSASVGPLVAATQVGTDPATEPRKLTQRPEVIDILSSPPTSGTATLSWNPNTEPDLAGYRVYVGLASGVYGPPINAGNLTSLQVTDLPLGQTYFFAVTAVNISNMESGFSNEVSKSIF